MQEFSSRHYRQRQRQWGFSSCFSAIPFSSIPCALFCRGDIGRMRNIVALDNVLVEQLNENPFRHVNYEIGSQPYACKEEYFHTIRSDR